MVKIKFVDVHWEFDKKNNFITDILDKHFGGYEFSDEPDFLFFMCEGTEHYKYDNCVKVFFTGEYCASQTKTGCRDLAPFSSSISS